jgi:hypothetical protein
MSDHFSLIRQQTADWLKASGYHRSDLAKELGWSESFFSEFMSEKSGLGGLKLCQLAAVVSKPPKTTKPNKGARICGIQAMGRTVKGVFELNEANMAGFANNHAKTNFNQRRIDALNINVGTQYEVIRDQKEFSK